MVPPGSSANALKLLWSSAKPLIDMILTAACVSETEYHDTCSMAMLKKCTLVGNKIVDHSDVVGASSVGAAPTTSSFST